MCVLSLFILSFVVLSVNGALYSYRNKYFDSGNIKKLHFGNGNARQTLHRQRRATPGKDPIGKMLFTDVVLNGTEDHTQAFVHWSGKDKSEAVFILTLKVNASGSVIDSQTWRSQDYGKTYRKMNFTKGALISYFYVSPADPTRMVFTDVQNMKIYRSTNELVSYETFSLPVATDQIFMHPSNKDWMILYDYLPRRVYVTMNFGMNWTLLHGDVNRMFWGIKDYADDAKTVHLEIQPQDSDKAYYKKCTIPDCKAAGDQTDLDLGPFMPQTLLVANEFIFVQKTDWDGTNSNVMVSHNRTAFKHAFFPANVKTKDFLVVNADEGQVFMAVSHGDSSGASLFLSDTTGRFYTICMENIHHRATRNWFEVDLHEVKGLPGTYLANQLLDSDKPAEGRKLKTLISVDKGGEWAPLETDCENGAHNCTLVLRLDLDNFIMDWILSETNAPGIIIAHGHFGITYEQDLDQMSIFTSTDGGWNWKKAPFTGLYHFNILDQGGVITAILNGQQETTNIVHYTYDDGKNWITEIFGSNHLNVDGVLNEPEINTLVVSVYGHQSAVSPWTMVELNFSRVLTQKCIDNQREAWTPTDHDKTFHELCILGQEVNYERRKPDEICFYGEPFNRTIVKATCTCEEEDFECDFGYKGDGTVCRREQWFTSSYLALECNEGKPFLAGQGYRKIGSDKCTGGKENSEPYWKKNITCPLVIPDQLILMSNVTVVATGDPVQFHLSQKLGSMGGTQYFWDFNDGHLANVTGLTNASLQTHSFSSPGSYNISVRASNTQGQSVSNFIQLRVEAAIHKVGVFSVWAAKVDFPVSVSVMSNVGQSDALGSLHYVWRFGDEADQDKGVLTWEPTTNHTYNKPGTYIMTVTVVNSVSALSKQMKIKVFDGAIMVQLSFSTNINRLLFHMGFSPVAQAIFLDSMMQELSLRTGVNLDRLCITLNSTIPVRTNVLLVPPPAGSSSDEPSAQQIVDQLVSLVKNNTLYLYQSISSRLGDIQVTNIQILKNGGGGGGGGSGSDADKKSDGPNYRAVYIAIPIVILAALVTSMVLIYYRRRFRNLRRYSLVNQHEDTDALLDDDDEPPLDLRSDNRDDSRSRDDTMLDLGTGSHLVMVTGSGGGDNGENC